MRSYRTNPIPPYVPTTYIDTDGVVCQVQMANATDICAALVPDVTRREICHAALGLLSPAVEQDADVAFSLYAELIGANGFTMGHIAFLLFVIGALCVAVGSAKCVTVMRLCDPALALVNGPTGMETKLGVGLLRNLSGATGVSMGHIGVICLLVGAALMGIATLQGAVRD